MTPQPPQPLAPAPPLPYATKRSRRHPRAIPCFIFAFVPELAYLVTYLLPEGASTAFTIIAIAAFVAAPLACAILAAATIYQIRKHPDQWHGRSFLIAAILISLFHLLCALAFAVFLVFVENFVAFPGPR
ncbi:MAG TPA: hypothetical protein VHQ47_06515 [Phycisphaerae bacterium]|nr:hypothetical protein [Phycisphaerae bacterium]